MTLPPADPGLSNSEALAELLEADDAVFQAVAGWNTPFLDTVMRPLSNAANNSVLWIGTAAAIAAVGGRRGRFIAAQGLVAVGLTSAVANLAAKNLVRRTRPMTGVPEKRRIEQPDSSSFPSGHTASAAAFSGIIGDEITPLLVPINITAAAVGFSRVYTGVHYPGDVLFGWILGRIVAGIVRTVWPKKWH